MNNKAITIILIVAVLALLYYLFGRTPNNNPDANSTRTEDSLRRVILTFEEKQKNLDSTILHLSESIDSLNGLVEKNRNDLVNLKQKFNEKNTAISKFSSNDIYKYLSNRYANKDTATVQSTGR